MKVCVIGSKARAASTMKIFEALKNAKKFKSVFFASTEGIKIGVKDGDFPIFYKDIDLCKFNVAVPRIGASKALFGYLIVKYLKESDVYVPVSPESILISHNKFLTLEVLNDADIPIPETYLTMSPATAKRVVEKMKPPVVMKLLGGSGGKGVMFAPEKNSAFTMIDTLGVLNQPLFIEKYVKNPGEDIRVIVVGNEAVASMKRKAKKGEKRSNLAAGGKGVAYKIDSEIEDISIKSAKAIGAEICGVDIIEGPNGPVVLELNICPGMKISKVTGINVERSIAEYVANKGEYRKPIVEVKGISYYIGKLMKRFSDAMEE
jgi:ribosomal protein S6--L-glutamate ligase